MKSKILKRCLQKTLLLQLKTRCVTVLSSVDHPCQVPKWPGAYELQKCLLFLQGMQFTEFPSLPCPSARPGDLGRPMGWADTTSHAWSSTLSPPLHIDTTQKMGQRTLKPWRLVEPQNEGIWVPESLST